MGLTRVLLVVTLGVGLVACTSPESTRMRGGDRGADVDNRKAEVELHAGANPYYNTPCLSPLGKCWQVKSASQY